MSEEEVPVVKKRKRRARKPRGAVEIRIGKRRFFAAAMGEISFEATGHLSIYTNGKTIYVPVAGKAFSITAPMAQPNEIRYSAAAVTDKPEWMRGPTEEEAIAAVEREAAEFKLRKREELNGLMRVVRGQGDSE